MITINSLTQNPRSIQIGDVIYFKAPDFDMETVYAFGRWLDNQEWFRPHLGGFSLGKIPDNAETGLNLSMMHIKILEGLYAKTRDKGENPSWISTLPSEIVRYLEYMWLQNAWTFEPYAIMPFMPHAGIGYIVTEGGLIHQISRVFDVPRLHFIKQLAGLTDPTVTNQQVVEYPQTFQNSRFEHSLDVLAIAYLIGSNCGLSKQDLNTLRLCAFSHDVMTPAGGDAIKRIDMEGLDEDKNFPRCFLKKDWKELRNQYGFSEKLIAETILGKGLLGRILDLADKLAYVGRDFWMFSNKNPKGGEFWLNFPGIWNRMQALIRFNPNPYSLWECARIIEGQLVLTDGNRLADFLRLRALMFKALYFNASARFTETAYLTQISKLLYEDGTLTTEQLLKMHDKDLYLIIEKALGLPEHSVGWIIGGENPRVEKFQTAEEALSFERQIFKEEPETMTCLDVHPNPSGKSGTEFNVLTSGRILPFSQAYPFEAWDIQQLLVEENPHRVFLYDLKRLCPKASMQKRLIENRRKRIGT